MNLTSIGKYFHDKFGGRKKAEMDYLLSAYRNRFNDDAGYGEFVLRDLMRFANMDKVVNVGELSERSFEFIEGKRAVIHYIFDMLNIGEIDMLESKRSKK